MDHLSLRGMLPIKPVLNLLCSSWSLIPHLGSQRLKLDGQLGIGVIELLLKRGFEGFLFIEPLDAIGKLRNR